MHLVVLLLLSTWIPSSTARGRRSAEGQACEQSFAPPRTPGSKAGGVIERGYGIPPAARLGNHLFMYASAFGVAFANGMELRHRPWPPGRDPNLFEVFTIPPNFAPAGHPRLIHLAEARGKALGFEPACLSLKEGAYDWGGYRQSFKYFNHGAGEKALRATLQLRNTSLVSRAQELLEPANSSSFRSRHRTAAAAWTAAAAAMDVRSGMGNLGAFGGCLPDAAYYLRALSYYRQRFPRVAFVYAAEPAGMAWFKQEVIAHDALKGFDCFPLGTENPIETFAALSRCDANVFSYGSFGWFAAWLAHGPVVYSKHLKGNPRNCDTVARSGVGIDDHIPPEWIAI